MRYGDKKLRHELKYYISYPQYNELRQRLKSIIRQDSNAISDEGYHIRSLYFDDAYDSALYQKNAGIFERKKFRIRIYNKRDAIINLECKRKFGQYISKDSTPLSRKDVENIFANNIEFLLEEDNDLKRRFYLEIKNNLLKPKVIVDYLREAYVLNISDIRITFDKELRGGLNDFNLFDPNLPTVKAISEGTMILEIKYNDFLPKYLHDLLQISCCNTQALSKYVICREVLFSTR